MRRLTLALTGVHAARPATLRGQLLDDTGLPDRRITIGGHPRRLDDLTARTITQYLFHRHRRWPRTINPRLIVSEHSAQNENPVSPHLAR
ncbi:hypothetical protein ACIPSA_48570 [Streptomyces sp. NPDC086549]|uniref:hypothetical protein n=1 Tax=Streptomyces sp. NPDC086549 TaxID=3365752 RepID=UPI0037F7E33A